MVGVLLLASGWLYVRRVRREVEATWSRHTGSAPSRVYARTLDLYPGRPLERPELLDALRERGYRTVPDGGVPAPGRVHVSGGVLEVGLHRFSYPPPEGRFAGFPVRIRIDGGRIASLRDMAADTAAFDVRLEPVETATLLDRRMVLRTPVALSRVPAVLTEAVLAVEDRRFFEHGGVDPVRLVGAAVHDLLHGRLEQGGSTLTQQLVKNFYLTPARTIGRKLREAVMAFVLEHDHDKAEILEAYLNEVYMGQRGPVSIVGVQEAARHYFSRDVSGLDPAQAALLAGLIRSPARYDPFRHPDAALRRRSVVLGLMEARGGIDASERARAEREPLPDPAAERPVDAAPYFVDYVEGELARRYPREA
ncbi:MAG TPA: transglycosylase domain-containing protein, partial [Gemmatimonadota bacterium]|nr:transglycosylase domain-containing protein [Gemmatimonadota bacterium]